MEEILLYLAFKYQGQFDKIYQAIQKKELADEEELAVFKKQLKSNYTTIVSDDYPDALKQIACPPFVLFYYGDLSLVNQKTVGVIGMRKPSDYGKEVTKDFVKGLVKEDYVIVSGMAYGIDSIAHQQAIDSGGKTVAVLGSGIDYCYPKEHRGIYEEMKENHLVISEYPLDLSPQKWYFPARNRLISAFSDSVLVTEAKNRSGTMITVGYALEQGKDVMAVPCDVNGNEGCNILIQQGAKLVKNVEDIVEFL